MEKFPTNFVSKNFVNQKKKEKRKKGKISRVIPRTTRKIGYDATKIYRVESKRASEVICTMAHECCMTVWITVSQISILEVISISKILLSCWSSLSVLVGITRFFKESFQSRTDECINYYPSTKGAITERQKIAVSNIRLSLFPLFKTRDKRKIYLHPAHDKCHDN